ncbi:MAG: glyoxalase [Micrococcaceae bacterium]|nr:glyoxalase [Micrococcaceae bacterium]
MAETSRPRLSATVLGAPDARALAVFYRDLLGWEMSQEEPDWVMLKSPDGGAGLSFQTESNYQRPAWPEEPGRQQMMMHLDIQVQNLAAAEERARSLGAVRADHQPQDDVRVCLDPAGHPFCLFVD